MNNPSAVEKMVNLCKVFYVEVTEEMLLKVLTNMLMKGMIVPRKEGDKNGM